MFWAHRKQFSRVQKDSINNNSYFSTEGYVTFNADERVPCDHKEFIVWYVTELYEMNAIPFSFTEFEK